MREQEAKSKIMKFTCVLHVWKKRREEEEESGECLIILLDEEASNQGL